MTKMFWRNPNGQLLEVSVVTKMAGTSIVRRSKGSVFSAKNCDLYTHRPNHGIKQKIVLVGHLSTKQIENLGRDPKEFIFAEVHVTATLHLNPNDTWHICIPNNALTTIVWGEENDEQRMNFSKFIYQTGANSADWRERLQDAMCLEDGNEREISEVANHYTIYRKDLRRAA